MASVKKCPICEGRGKVYGGFETGTVPEQTCHGCCGRGWVEVDDGYKEGKWLKEKLD